MMKDRLLKYTFIIGAIVAIIFIIGLIMEILSSVNDFIIANATVFSLLVIGGIIYYYSYQKQEQPVVKNKETVQDNIPYTLGVNYSLLESMLIPGSPSTKTINGVQFKVFVLNSKKPFWVFRTTVSRGVNFLFYGERLEALFFRFTGDHYDFLFNKINKCLDESKTLLEDPFCSGKSAMSPTLNGTHIELRLKEDGNTGICYMSDFYYKNRKPKLKSK